MPELPPPPVAVVEEVAVLSSVALLGVTVRSVLVSVVVAIGEAM